jgi:isopentenyl diphosphate isomerase/L-lactate dehydrogenase-like FMN-dependent dehydrogenase
MKTQFRELFQMLRAGGTPKGADAMHSVDDVRRSAKKRLPEMIYDFIYGGAYDELTLSANRSDFSDILFRPKLLTDVSDRNQRTRVVGQELAFPVMVSPAGLLRLAHTEGELAIARAAGNTGVVFVVSTAASWSMEEIAEAATGPLWFQLYLWRDRDIMRSLVERAKQAEYQALVLTVDLQVVGKRERDLRNGLSIPPKISLGSALDAVLHPRWFLDLIKGPPVAFRNFLGIAEGDDTLSHSAFINRHLINPSANWQDLQWVRELWKGPLLVKGIITPEDALKAVDSGVDGIIVSNHGGRQLDGVSSAIRALPRIFDAVGNRADLILDSGVRRGADVVKAMALGACAVMTGRSWIWGLAAAGQPGVERVQAILAQEIDETLALLGRSNLEEIDRSVVEVPASWDTP